MLVLLLVETVIDKDMQSEGVGSRVSLCMARVTQCSLLWKTMGTRIFFLIGREWTKLQDFINQLFSLWSYRPVLPSVKYFRCLAPLSSVQCSPNWFSASSVFTITRTDVFFPKHSAHPEHVPPAHRGAQPPHTVHPVHSAWFLASLLPPFSIAHSLFPLPRAIIQIPSVHGAYITVWDLPTVQPELITFYLVILLSTCNTTHS